MHHLLPDSVHTKLLDEMRGAEPAPYNVSSGDMIVAMTYAKGGAPYVDQSPRVAQFEEGVSYRAEGYLVHDADGIYRFVRIEECGNWAIILLPLEILLNMDAVDFLEDAPAIPYGMVANGTSLMGGEPIFRGRGALGSGTGLGGSGTGLGGLPIVGGSDHTNHSILPPQVAPRTKSPPPQVIVNPLPPSMLLLGTAFAGIAGLGLARGRLRGDRQVGGRKREVPASMGRC